ncbi:hypothetical protein FIBSPDRAFT_894939 [Athelia psychrophila]|uniref:Uncharacterized protein n=1 Tax=Athelia psychrophila TaxID=1759441 RepID=A0A166F6Q0_9AGAM|nr:hypothetical protein FIBSPDRAFT_894939 [Fibularhizoctonia sp. CBS 109695]
MPLDGDFHRVGLMYSSIFISFRSDEDQEVPIQLKDAFKSTVFEKNRHTEKSFTEFDLALFQSGITLAGVEEFQNTFRSLQTGQANLLSGHLLSCLRTMMVRREENMSRVRRPVPGLSNDTTIVTAKFRAAFGPLRSGTLLSVGIGIGATIPSHWGPVGRWCS